MCDKGKESKGGTTCLPCDRGYYKDEKAAKPCDKCPADVNGITGPTTTVDPTAATDVDDVEDCNIRKIPWNVDEKFIVRKQNNRLLFIGVVLRLAVSYFTQKRIDKKELKNCQA